MATWQGNLKQLVDTGYLKAVPMDPFSSGPLVYRRKNNDFVLYSVGRHSQDNGGTNDDIVFWMVDSKK